MTLQRLGWRKVALALLAGIVIEALALLVGSRASDNFVVRLLGWTQEPLWHVSAFLTPLLFPHGGFEGQIADFVPTLLLLQGIIYGALGCLLLSISWRNRGPT